MVVDRAELARWSEMVSARSELPRLIRRLILETTPGLVGLGMPAGEGTSLSGWDGTCKATASTPWVPAGLSLWEISVDKNAERKANQDYEKRSSTPDGSPACTATYVALSLRPWSNRAEWALNRDTEGSWREVRAYGLDDVDVWLEDAPITRAWLAVELGFHPYGYRSAEQWWNIWTSQTTPHITPAMVLAGRAEEAVSLLERLQGDPTVTTIHGRSRDDILAFIYATVATHSGDLEGEQLLARMGFVDDLASWRELQERTSPLVLVSMREEFARDHPAYSNHNVIVPVTHGPSNIADIRLPRLDGSVVAAELRKAKIDEEKSIRFGHLARRSLEALRLRLSPNPILLTPKWAKGSIPQTSRAALLAGSWSDEHDGDKEILSKLAERPYPQLREELNDLKRLEHPLVDTVSGSWHVVSPEDAWIFLCRHLTKEDLQNLKEASCRVLGERDPAFDLDPGNRWMANVVGKARTYSEELRRGLARSIAFLALHGADVDAPGGGTGADWASYLVRSLLPKENDALAADMWGSLADVLSQLAEAAPDEFITAVQRSLVSDTSPFTDLFLYSQGGGSPLTSPRDFPHLLWALERLAWSSDYFAAVVDILAELARFPFSEQVLPNSFSSLESLFRPWHPSTTAPLSGRLQALDRLRKRAPDMAWRLMVALMPRRGYFIVDPTSQPEFRDWKTDVTVSPAECDSFLESLFYRLSADAAGDGSRFGILIEAMPGVSSVFRTVILDALEAEIDQDSLPVDEQKPFQEKMLKGAREYRTSNETGWGLLDSEACRLQDMAKRMQCDDLASDTSWLFEKLYPTIPGLKTASEAHNARLAELRKEAVITVHDQFGLEGVLGLTVCNEPSRSSSAWAVGTALWDAFGAELQGDMLAYLKEDMTEIACEVAYYYFGKQFRSAGWAWLDRILGREDLTVEQKARLLLHPDAEPRTWDVVADLGSEAESYYWGMFRVEGRGQDFQYVDFVAEKLIGVQRHHIALVLFVIDGIKTEKAARLATHALENLDLQHIQGSILSAPDAIQELLKAIREHTDATGEKRLAMLEWTFLPTFGTDYPAETLYRWLQQSPPFFVEMVCMVFLPRNRNRDADQDVDEAERLRRHHLASKAYRLLQSWKWSLDDASDFETQRQQLSEWIAQARKQLNEADRLAVGEQSIGQMLGSIAQECDEDWPHIIVRDLLEEISSEHIETGVHLARVNGRGVTVRPPDEGGTQERELAAHYRQQAQEAAFRWPRTSRLLRNIADSYAGESRSHDDDAERFRSGLD